MPSNSKEYMRDYMYGKGGYMTRDKKDDKAMRMRARRKAEKEGKVSSGDGKEVDHIRGLSGGNGDSNIRILSQEQNRRNGVKKAIRSRKARLSNGGSY